jgi:hypothetical protein
MKDTKEPLIVYWAPATYESDQESWSFLYTEPTSLFSEVTQMRATNVGADNIYACPAFKASTNNVFVIKNVVENVVSFPEGFLKDANDTIASNSNFSTNLIPFGKNLESRVFLNVLRKPSVKDHANVLYNMSWLFIAEDSVVAKITPPYYPQTSPANGAMLSIGEFDIGQWFRPFVLDYHIPMSTDKMTFLEGDDLCYIHFNTDRPIIFKRFMHTATIAKLQQECSEAGRRYGTFKPLTQRYAMAKKAKIKEQFISEIKKHLVE